VKQICTVKSKLNISIRLIEKKKIFICSSHSQEPHEQKQSEGENIADVSAKSDQSKFRIIV
jgi:hypothetical protein